LVHAITSTITAIPASQSETDASRVQPAFLAGIIDSVLAARRDECHVHLPRSGAAVERELARRVRRYIADGPGTVAQSEVAVVGDVAGIDLRELGAAWKVKVEAQPHHIARGSHVWRGAEEERVDHAHHGDGGSDPDREADDGCYRRSGRPAQGAIRVAHDSAGIEHGVPGRDRDGCRALFLASGDGEAARRRVLPRCALPAPPTTYGTVSS
jgi:hypothetical protein